MYFGQKVFYGLKRVKENIFFTFQEKRFSLDDDQWTNEKSNKIVLIGKDLNHKKLNPTRIL